MSDEVKRWSGFSTQSKAWQDGYEWEYHRGPHAELEMLDACDAYGHNLHGPAADDFGNGVQFAQGEQFS